MKVKIYALKKRLETYENFIKNHCKDDGSIEIINRKISETKDLIVGTVMDCSDEDLKKSGI